MIKTTDLCDRYHEELQICEPMFQSFGGKRWFSGPIATVQVLEDNVLVREAIDTVPEGTVLVVDGGASKRCALLGDRLAGIAASRGLSGIIIHGYVRDTADLKDLDIGILALGSVPLKSGKEGKGERNIPLNFGGVRWIPNHVVYADEDGVVVAPRELKID